MKTIWIVEGVVTDPEAHAEECSIGDTKWQFSDGSPDQRGSSVDFLSLEEGIRAHSEYNLIFVPAKSYSHVYRLAFTVSGSRTPDGSDVTMEMLRKGLVDRYRDLEMDYSQWLEETGSPHDTCEE